MATTQSNTNNMMQKPCPTVTVQSFVPYTSDDLTGTPQNNSVPTRLLRTRIDVGLIRQDTTAIRASVAALQAAATNNNPNNNGSSSTTMSPALTARLDRIDSTLNQIVASLTNVVGPPVGGQGFVQQDFHNVELLRLITPGITPQSVVANSTSTHTMQINVANVTSWMDSTESGDGILVLPNRERFTLLSRPMPYASGALIFAMNLTGNTINILCIDANGQLIRNAYPWGSIPTTGALSFAPPPIPMRNATGPTNTGPIPQSPHPVNLQNIQGLLHAVRTMLRDTVPQFDVTPQATTDLKIADVEQLIEAPNERQVAALPVETEKDVLDSWNIQKILSRPALMSRTIWGTQEVGTELATNSFPNRWLANEDTNRHFSNLLNSFNMVKMNVVFRLMVNSTAMYGGVLAMYFDFFDRVMSYTDAPPSATAVSNCDPIYLDLSKGTTAELSLPFSAVSQYLTRTSDFASQFLGSVKVVAMSNLSKPPQAPDVEVRVYAYLEGVDVAVLAEPETRNFVVPQASVVRTITSFAHSFLPGMRDPYPLALEDKYKLDRTSSCRVEKVCGTFGLIGSINWSTTDENNLIKAEIPVHPMLPFRNYNGTTAGVDTVTPDGPKMMHLGRHYSYWNGDIEYRIQVACSNVHAGKLMIVFIPGSLPTVGQLGAISANPHLLLDVKERHEITFTVPYISPTAWKPTYINGFFADIRRFATGYISIRSADPIKSPFENPSVVTINIYARAAPNFQYAVPRNGLNTAARYGSIITQDSFLTSVRPNLRMNSEDFNDLYKVMRRYVNVGGNINVPPLNPDGTLGNINFNANPESIVIPVRPMKLNTEAPNSIGHICRGFSFWRGSLKYKIKVIGGGTSFEVIHVPTHGIPANMNDFFVTRPTTFDAGQAGSLAGSQLFEAGTDKEWEVVVPYYSMYDWLHLATKDYTTVGAKLPLLSTNNGCLIIRPLFRGARYSLSVSMSVGEDFELAGPSTFPAITFPENQNATNNSFTVVAQGSVDYPKYVKNPVFREAWDSLPLDSVARTSKTQFNKQFYKRCNECGFNVFIYKHTERCNPNGSRPVQSETVEVQGLTDFFSKLSGTNDMLNMFVQNWSAETPESTAEKLVEVIRSSVKALLQDAKIAVRDWFSRIMSAVDWRLFISALVAGCAIYALRDILDTPVAQIALAGISMLVSHKFVTFIAQLWQKEQCHIRVQNGSGLQFSTLVQLCCGVMVYFLNLASSNSASKIIKGLGDLGRSLSGIKAGTDALAVFSTWMEEKLVPELSPTDGNILRGLMANSLDTLSAVSNLNLEEMKVRCLSEVAIREEVLKTYDNCHHLVKVAIANNAPASINQALSRAMTKMEKLRTEVMAYKGNQPFRIDPYHVSIFGEPGCGKSACMRQIIEDFRVMEDWPEANLMYSRNADADHWDGYHGQTAVVYDDLAQVVKDSPCDITEMIGLKSNNPVQVKGAAIEDKGKYFTSLFLISSTNVKMLNTFGGLRKPAAFHRRRNILMEMRKKVIDGVEAPFMDDTPEERCRHAEFRLLDSMTGVPETQEFFSYEQIMAIVLQRGQAYYATQRELLRRATDEIKPSSVAQAIINERIRNLPVVVDTNGAVHIIDAEAQGLFDRSSADEQAWFLKSWKDAFDAAWERRDFGLMTSGFDPTSRLNIINAISTSDFTNLNFLEMNIFRKFKLHDRLRIMSEKRSAEISVMASRVSSYFGDLWDQYKPTEKKHLATGLAGMGVIAIALSLAYRYTKRDNVDRSTNEIPVSAFAEAVPLGYESKNRKENDYKVEGAAEGKEWVKAHPGIIPYRYEIVPGRGWLRLPELGGETQEWKDFVDYGNATGQDPFSYRGIQFIPESGIDDEKTRRLGPKKLMVESGIDDEKTRRRGPKTLSVESGIDDYKTRRQGPKTINVEGMFDKSPMVADVPVSILELSEEDLMEEMKKVQIKGDIVEVKTNVERYHVELPTDAQATTDNVTATLIDNGLLDNLALVYHPGSSLRMRAFMLDDRFMGVPKHFFLNSEADFKTDPHFILRVREKAYTIYFDPKALHIIPKRDFAVYLLPANVTSARKITDKIATLEEHARFRETTGSLLGLMCNDKKQIWVKQRALPAIHAMTEADHLRVQYTIGQENHVLKGFRYYADTVNGECGSLLLQNNKYMQGKIIGFHVAASLGKQLAFSELLIRSEVEDAMASLKFTMKYVSGGSSISVVDKLIENGIVKQGTVSPAFANLHTHIDIAGPLSPELVKKTPGKTEIKPSLLHGVIDIAPKTEPAVLSHKDPRCPKGYDPLVGAVNKFSKPALPFNPEHLRIVQDHMVTKYRGYSGFINKRLLSLDEAINGIHGIEYADSINMKSAEGAFWNSERPILEHNKEWMFSSSEINGRKHYKISHKPLLAKILHRIKEAQEGRRVMSVTQECLKDERRGLNKIYCDEPATRVFTIMPVDYTIVFRQYFWDFSAMLMKNRGELGPQVGINPLSIEWTNLMCRLKAKSTKGFAGDYKNYDSQEMPELMYNACEIINRWYDDGPINAQVRHVLFQEGYDRYSICHDAIIHIDQGLPSGFPATSLVNSVNNDQYRYLGWLTLAPPEMKSLAKCDEETDRVSYGDDHVDAVTDKALPFFNQRTYGKFLEDHRITYTDAHKNQWRDAAEWEPVEGTSFLKRGFVPHPNYKRFYLAPLEKKSIEDRLLWITSSKYASEEELQAENIKNSMLDAYQHGALYYNSLYSKTDLALRSIGQEKLLQPISYSSLDYEWLCTIPGMGMSHTQEVNDLMGV